MRSSVKDVASSLIASALVATVLAACGRMSGARTGATEQTAKLPIAALQTTVNDSGFSISQTESQISADQMKIGSTGIGKIDFSGSATVDKKVYKFDLKGEIGADGMAILRPDDRTIPLRARVFCLDSSDPNARACDQYFVDVYFRQSDDKFLHVQLVRHSDFSAPDVAATPATTTPPVKPAAPAQPVAPVKPAAPAPTVQVPAKPAPVAPVKPTTVPPIVVKPAPIKPAPAKPVLVPPVVQVPKKVIPKPVTPVKPAPPVADTGTAATTEEDDSDDAPAPDGAYVGLQDKDKIQELFDDKTHDDEAATATLSPDMGGEQTDRPTDQAVGTYDRGHLEHASALDPSDANYYIPALNLKRYFGAYVTIRFIDNFATLVMHKVPGFRLRVDDIAAKAGGPLCRSDGSRNANGTCKRAHASHEIGLDADIGYLMDVPYTSVPQAVARGRMSTHMRKPVQWDMFKMIARSKLVSTVFVDPAVKRGFCAYAQTLGQQKTGDGAAALTMLRPLESHQTHFHLRFVCTKFNPRCRNEKVAGRPLGC